MELYNSGRAENISSDAVTRPPNRDKVTVPQNGRLFSRKCRQNGDIVNNNDVQKSKPTGTYECSLSAQRWFVGLRCALRSGVPLIQGDATSLQARPTKIL